MLQASRKPLLFSRFVYRRLLRMVSFAFLVSLLMLGVLTPAAAQEKRPNILLIVADDMGWSDAGVYGGEIFTLPGDNCRKQAIAQAYVIYSPRQPMFQHCPTTSDAAE
jgi:hypothetical protein